MRYRLMDCDQDAQEKGGISKKRRRSVQVEKEEEGKVCRRRKKVSASNFFDEEAIVDDDEEEEEEEEGKDDFIVEGGADLPEEDYGIKMGGSRVLPQFQEDHEDLDALVASIQEKYRRPLTEFDEETTDVEQQALLPSVRDPKLWMVKCAIGHERKTAVCLMQKYTDKGSKLQIRSAIALNHLKNYIYVEADKEAHVREACKGLRSMFGQKPMLVPIREMTGVLSVGSKAVNLARDTRVRRKIGREVVKKKAFVFPQPRVNEARELHKRQFMTGDFVLFVREI